MFRRRRRRFERQGAPLTEYGSSDIDEPMQFEIPGEISDFFDFRCGSWIREFARLRKVYGRDRWRKRKGIARVRLADGAIHTAEIHWYEAAGIWREEFKIKHLL
jgi:hypothetical protein